jgi:hypothetical protein
MKKKMKSPDKMPPVASLATSVNGANAPTLEVTEKTAQISATDTTAPTKNPPQSSSSSSGAISADGVAVWNNDKRVNGLYTTYHSRNAWMSVPGLGWKKLATGSDSMNEAMTLLAAHCREKSCRIDFSEDGGLIHEMYVW